MSLFRWRHSPRHLADPFACSYTHESTTAILPGLREILFSRSGREVPECTNEHYTRLRDFVSARNGTLTRLGIPRMRNMDLLQPLKDHVPQFEVRF